MSPIDWLIISSLLVFMVWASLKTRKYQTCVADFLVANRCAGRYMLGVSEGIASVGVVTVIAMFEAYYEAGFSLIWWGIGYNIFLLVVALSGWVVYRYRQTRVMTLAQLLEMRYSRRFRVFAGFLIFASGTLNFGIFPAIGARFFQHFCGLPAINCSLGFFEADVVYGLILFALVAFALFFTFMSGQIAVMVIAFIQGTIFNAIFCFVLIYLLVKVSWSDVIGILSQSPQGQSMINPFDAGQTQNFNVWYYIIQSFGVFYCVRAWQGNQGYFGAALNAHEARMGNILGLLRTLIQQFSIFIIPVFAYVLIRHVSYPELAAAVSGHLNSLGDEVLQKQLTTTVILAKYLPVGVLGMFAAAMLAAQISTDDTYMHSWGSIFIQDVVVPLRKKQFQPEKHVRYLKYSICGVGVFAFLFSLLFPQNDYVLMYLAMTGTIWLGGAGAVIIGGLYWRKGTTLGAYGALITGIVFAVISFAMPRIWAAQGRVFPLNSQWLWFISMLVSSVVYVVLSLIENADYNLDKLLHRGSYEIKEEQPDNFVKAKNIGLWQKIAGITTDFTTSDKVIYFGIAGFIIIVIALLALGTLYHLTIGISDGGWSNIWLLFIWITISVSAVTTVWFTMGGIKDIRTMFGLLKNTVRDKSDDGSVDG